MRMMFDYYGTEQMIICLDPANLDLMRDFMSDRANTRILEVQCLFDDQYLVGHAHRVGLATDDTPGEVIARMLPTLRHEFLDEQTAIREAEFPRHFRLREGRSLAENGTVLSEFFGIDPERGQALAETQHLFAD